FYLIALFDVIIVLKYKSALISGSYFLHVILETLQGCKRSVEYDDSVADQTAGTVPFENTVLNISACDSPDAGSLECLTDFGVSEDLLLEYRIQHALHGSLHVFDGIVDHAVKPYI